MAWNKGLLQRGISMLDPRPLRDVMFGYDIPDLNAARTRPATSTRALELKARLKQAMQGESGSMLTQEDKQAMGKALSDSQGPTGNPAVPSSIIDSPPARDTPRSIAETQKGTGIFTTVDGKKREWQRPNLQTPELKSGEVYDPRLGRVMKAGDAIEMLKQRSEAERESSESKRRNLEALTASGGLGVNAPRESAIDIKERKQREQISAMPEGNEKQNALDRLEANADARVMANDELLNTERWAKRQATVDGFYSQKLISKRQKHDMEKVNRLAEVEEKKAMKELEVLKAQTQSEERKAEALRLQHETDSEIARDRNKIEADKITALERMDLSRIESERAIATEKNDTERLKTLDAAKAAIEEAGIERIYTDEGIEKGQIGKWNATLTGAAIQAGTIDEETAEVLAKLMNDGKLRASLTGCFKRAKEQNSEEKDGQILLDVYESFFMN